MFQVVSRGPSPAGAASRWANPARVAPVARQVAAHPTRVGALAMDPGEEAAAIWGRDRHSAVVRPVDQVPLVARLRARLRLLRRPLSFRGDAHLWTTYLNR